MEDHVPRHAQMGAWVLINDRWYYVRDNLTSDACALLDLLADPDDPRDLFGMLQRAKT